MGQVSYPSGVNLVLRTFLTVLLSPNFCVEYVEMRKGSSATRRVAARSLAVRPTGPLCKVL